MTRKGAEQAIILSGLVVASTWGYRKLFEPHATNTPARAATIYEFAVGFGFSFFALSVIATFAPNFAGATAITAATADLLANGTQVFKDVNEGIAKAAGEGQKGKGH